MEKTSNFVLVVHIGTGKTGSSSIQKSLLASNSTLRKMGIAYLGLMGEESPVKRFAWQVASGWRELMKLEKSEAAQQLAEMLVASIEKLRADGFKSAIWSNESFYGNHTLLFPALDRVRAMGVSLNIIVYIRRHDAWARSAYLQWGIKHKTQKGPVKPFSEWYKKRQVRFAAGLRPWLKQSWGGITVRNFDACGDVVKDFLQYLRIDAAGVVTRRTNETPNAVALALWAIFNSQLDEPVLPAQLLKTMKGTTLLDRGPVDIDFNSLLPSEAEFESISKECSEDREKLNKIFAKFGQPPMDTSKLKYKAISVSQNQINAALLLLIHKQAEEIARLERILNTFEAPERIALTPALETPCSGGGKSKDQAGGKNKRQRMK